MHAVGLGLRTWPQWIGWGICRHSGHLYDPNGNAYRANEIAGAFLIWRAFDLRDRVWTPDHQPAMTNRYDKTQRPIA